MPLFDPDLADNTTHTAIGEYGRNWLWACKRTFANSHPEIVRFNLFLEEQKNIKPPQKIYPGTKLYALAEPQSLQVDLKELVRRRKTTRNFISCPLSYNDLSTMIALSFGKFESHRATSSGGGLYPLELYMINQFVEQIPQGIYHYNADRHELEQITETAAKPLLHKILVEPTIRMQYAQLAQVVFFLTIVPERTCIKYGELGFRLGITEAGEVFQNMTLTALALGHSVWQQGAVIDEEFEKAAYVDGREEISVATLMIGQDAQITSSP